jgi:hypothetical protein
MSLINHGVYGFPCVRDPNDFSPDAECCSPEELAAHRRACDTYGTPAYEPNRGCYAEYDADGRLVKHVTRTSWGIGFNSIIETQCDACGSVENQTIHCWECGGDFCCASCWPKHDAEPECA